MSDRDALLAAILADPDDDTPRLVYADWLDEHGDGARAEFIRLQCASAARDPDQYDPADEEREAELEDLYRPRWLAGLPQFPWAHWFFRRGFPESLEVPTELFLERYEAFARVPWLRVLCLTTFHSPRAGYFANRDWNLHWVELELRGYGTDVSDARAVGAIVGTSQVRQLRRLRFSDYLFDSEAIGALVASPHLDELCILDIPVDQGSPLYALLRERFGDRLVGDED